MRTTWWSPIPRACPPWQVLRYVLRVRTNMAIILAASLGYLFLAGLRTFAIIFARGHFRVGQAMATALLGVIGAGAVLGLLTAGRTADRLISRGHLSARIVVAAIAYIVGRGLAAARLLSTKSLRLAAAADPGGGRHLRAQPASGRGSARRGAGPALGPGPGHPHRCAQRAGGHRDRCSSASSPACSWRTTPASARRPTKP